MDPLLISAASGMKSRMESLDMLANNIANSGTTGFKGDRELNGLFRDQLPLVQKQWTDFTQGTLAPTGNALDLGLSGAGFFALNSPAGVVYTRGGDFQISKTNQLQTADGYTLRNVLDNGKPIVVDPTQPIGRNKSGVVQQSGQTSGQIAIASIPTASDTLSKLGKTYFALMNNSQPAGPAPATEVHQGTLEQSNVPVADAAVKLVGVMRQFEMLQRAMALGSEMNKRAFDEVARVS
ncbi:MAG: flagellar hook-basal body protein [Bryobacteraceae bacterium]